MNINKNSKIKVLYKLINRNLLGVKWYNLRSLKPISDVFGLDRGMPIDRYYIEKFLSENKLLINGTVLEISDNYYTLKFGTEIIKSEILDYDPQNKKATILGDLSKKNILPEGIIDCFICTQTLNFIYDLKESVEGIFSLLNKNGIALITVAGISQISKYDMIRWGDYWRFTTKSLECLFAPIFGENNLEIKSYGNVLSAVSFLEGISSNELNKDELDYRDENFQVIISLKAKKI